MDDSGRRTPVDARLTRVGNRAWAALGIAGVVVLLYLLLQQVSLVATPLVVALFPAAVLWPVGTWLKRRGVPASVAALLLVLGLLAVLASGLWLVVPRFLAELPDLAESVEEALADLEALAAGTPFSLPFEVGGGLAVLAEDAFAALGESADVMDRGLEVARALADVATATVLFLIALFFYLRDGDRIWRAVTGLLPETSRGHVRRVSGQLFWTLGAYFRGQVVVALVDAVAIGIGLALLGVPLVLPLALLVFFGGFFPIVGAFASGLVAVLVALADQGPTTALLALALVVVVQQAEGNLLEPLILSPVLRLHPFLIIVAVTLGAITYGVLGAFLAVPLTACAGRVVDYARGRVPAAGPGSGSDGEPAWPDRVTPAPEDGEDGEDSEDAGPSGDQGTGREDDRPRGDVRAGPRRPGGASAAGS